MCTGVDKARQPAARTGLAVRGLFYMVEFHPLRDLLAGQPYFGSAAPDIEEEATYTDNGADA